MTHFHYDCNLDLKDFSNIIEDTTECYKFYWFDAILTMVENGKNDIEFEDLIDDMIASAWYTVYEHHLFLGPKNLAGETLDSLERAVKKISDEKEDLTFRNKESLIEFIRCNRPIISVEREKIGRNVPYRLLSVFMYEISGNDPIWDNKGRLIPYIDNLSKKKVLPYTIIPGVKLTKKVHINSEWYAFFKDNLVSLRGWVREGKITYIQKRNPAVPGVVYKLESETARKRKMENVRILWNKLLEVSPVRDIYYDKIELNCGGYEIDHFVPSSYVAHDEMWNLLPMDSKLNASKSNRLADWKYFSLFADSQYHLYQMIFDEGLFIKEFNNCYRDNIISPWAVEELYIKGKSENEFKGILEQHVHQIYDAARMQGYRRWDLQQAINDIYESR